MKAIPPLLGAPKGQWPKRSTPETQPRVIPLARKVAKEHPDVLGAQARADVLTERGRELATRVATTPGGHTAPPAGLRRIHEGSGAKRTCWPSTIARRPTMARRRSSDGSTSLRPRR